MEGVAIEQGMMIQNIGLMAQALGLGGFANFAPHPSSWFEALGFRMGSMPASRYLGANRLISSALAVLGRDRPFAYPLGLERAGEVLLKPFCPPYYPSMEAAVHAVIEAKFGAQGIFRGGAARSGWRDPAAASKRHSGAEQASHRRHRGLLRIHLRALRPLPRLLRALPHDHGLPGHSRRRGLLRSLLPA